MKCNEIVPTFMIFKGFFHINNNTQKKQNANTVLGCKFNGKFSKLFCLSNFL